MCGDLVQPPYAIAPVSLGLRANPSSPLTPGVVILQGNFAAANVSGLRPPH